MGNGSAGVCYKRLSDGRFQWPQSEAELRLLDPRRFRWLIEGLKVEQKTAIRKRNQRMFLEIKSNTTVISDRLMV